MFKFKWSENHDVEGVVAKFHSKNAMFWSEKNDFSPDLTRWNYASDIYEEEKYPHALVVNADICGVYIKVLWGEKIGWVFAKSLSSL